VQHLPQQNASQLLRKYQWNMIGIIKFITDNIQMDETNYMELEMNLKLSNIRTAQDISDECQSSGTTLQAMF
jgi:hypothetical protein